MPTIIHVDDDEMFLDLNEQVLGGLPDEVKVVGAANAQEALQAIRQAADPVLLIMDQWMPDLTGEQLWQECRDRFGDRAIKALMVTGSLDDQLEAKMGQLGVQYIWKPMRLDRYQQDVLAAVGSWLQTTVQTG